VDKVVVVGKVAAGGKVEGRMVRDAGAWADRSPVVPAATVSALNAGKENRMQGVFRVWK
jgi:hypothetical protein